MQPNEWISIGTAVGTLISVLVTLTLRSTVAEIRLKQAEDKEDLRGWIDERYLPSREADARLTRIESSHTDLKQRVDDNERRLRRVEQRRNRGNQVE